MKACDTCAHRRDYSEHYWTCAAPAPRYTRLYQTIGTLLVNRAQFQKADHPAPAVDDCPTYVKD